VQNLVTIPGYHTATDFFRPQLPRDLGIRQGQVRMRLSAAIRPLKSAVTESRNMLRYTATLGKSIAAGCSNFRLPPELQFAMHRVKMYFPRYPDTVQPRIKSRIKQLSHSTYSFLPLFLLHLLFHLGFLLGLLNSLCFAAAPWSFSRQYSPRFRRSAYNCQPILIPCSF
jgi:hypothetical protein